jgi:hypothetical protein
LQTSDLSKHWRAADSMGKVLAFGEKDS